MGHDMLSNIRSVLHGEKTVEAIARERLQILEKENPRVNAVVECHPDLFLTQAREIDEKVRAGKAGRLAGAVVTVKDNLDVKGMRSTAGFLRLKDNIAQKDSAAVTRLRAEDALILGKTNMPPGAMDAQTDNPVYGRTNHPLFPDRTCGGSSGGGACAVQLGISDADIGNDLMGSIRIPAHFCGIYGFVPTGGAISLHGFAGGKPVGSTMSQMLRIGLQAKTPEVIETLYSVLTEHGYPSANNVVGSRLKVAWSLDCGGLPLSRDSRECMKGYLEKLGENNDLYEIKGDDYPFSLARESFITLLYGAIAAMLPPAAFVAARYLMGNKHMDKRLKTYLMAENQREECKHAMRLLMERFDCLLTPVTATPAFPHMKPDRVVNGQPFYGDFLVDGQRTLYAAANLGYTTPFFTADPVMAMPVGVTGEGLPVGVQVVCGAYRENELMHIVKKLREDGMEKSMTCPIPSRV